MSSPSTSKLKSQVKSAKPLQAPVLYLCPQFPVLSETFVSDQVEALIAANVPVRVLALRAGNSAPLFKQWQSSPSHNAVMDILYPHGFTKSAILRALFKTAFTVAVRPTSWPLTIEFMLRARDLLKSAIMYAGAINIAQANGSLLVCHFGTTGHIGNLLRAWGVLSMPQLTIFHGYDVSAVILHKGRNYYKSLFASRGHTSLAITKYWKNELQKLGDKAPLMQHLGVNIDKFPYQPRKPKKGQPVRFITVGRLTSKKGQADVMQALAQLPKSANWEYHLVGDGEQKPELQTIAKKLGIEKRVHFYGALTANVTREKLAAADVFVLTSRTATNGDKEGLPVALMEALASGMPTLSTVHSGIPELIIHDENGLLSEEGDITGLSANIQRLLDEPKLWDKFAKNGRAMVENYFNFATNFSKFNTIIQSLKKD